MTISEILPAQPIGLAPLVDYAPGSIVSRVLHRGAAGSITLFAFDSGQDVSEHTTACDAYALVLDGRADLNVGGERARAEAGQVVMLPAGVPHSIRAPERFKMLLIMMRS
jgi:quercetin dioxygenase-like cupin family protein